MKQVRWTSLLGSSLGKDLGLPRWRLDLFFGRNPLDPWRGASNFLWDIGATNHVWNEVHNWTCAAQFYHLILSQLSQGVFVGHKNTLTTRFRYRIFCAINIPSILPMLWHLRRKAAFQRHFSDIWLINFANQVLIAHWATKWSDNCILLIQEISDQIVIFRNTALNHHPPWVVPGNDKKNSNGKFKMSARKY